MNGKFNDDDKCFACGGEASAFWGFEPVAVCSQCATTKLPLLIADAIGLPRTGKASDVQRAVSDALASITKEFHRGLSLRLIREANPPRVPEPGSFDELQR